MADIDGTPVEIVQAAVISTINTVGSALVGEDFTPITSSPIPDDEIARMLSELPGEADQPDGD